MMKANDELNEVTITPGPWKWVFVSTAGNWFLLGNNGEGPIARTGPGTPDGNLMRAAPDLLAAGEAALSALTLMNADEGTAGKKLRTAIAAARGVAGTPKEVA